MTYDERTLEEMTFDQMSLNERKHSTIMTFDEIVFDEMMRDVASFSTLIQLKIRTQSVATFVHKNSIRKLFY
jgi:hypothetical protein